MRGPIKCEVDKEKITQTYQESTYVSIQGEAKVGLKLLVWKIIQ